MRAVDADELIIQFRRAIETFLPEDPTRHMDLIDSFKSQGWQRGLELIQNAQTIYPEEIIHCKDCIHLVCYDYDVKGYIPYKSYNACWRSLCDKHWDREQGEYIDVNLDDYCSFAERK